mmetsp:Transcript_161743/g.298322  ORF Transcript_161743/g.298322 Transcript_161743/m.298322 type:complete len:163 (+) Transcript_161743:60-548(+)
MMRTISIFAVACLILRGSQGAKLVLNEGTASCGAESSMEETQGGLSIRAWTWNAGAGGFGSTKLQTDHTNMVNKLFQGRVTDDIIATCTLEDSPKKELHELLGDEGDKWALIAYGKHSGFAGEGENAQILSVFLRKQENVEVRHGCKSDDGASRRPDSGITD